MSTLRDILREFRTRPGRYALGLFSIAVGMLTLCLLLSMLLGLERKAERIAEDLGLNVIGVTVTPNNSNTRGLARRDVELLRASLSQTNCLVSGVRFDQAKSMDGKKALRVLATDPSLVAIRGWRMRDGRFLDSRDLDTLASICVVAQSKTSQHPKEPGSRYALTGAQLTVAGLLENGGESTELQDQRLMYGDEFLVVPHSAEAYWHQDGPRRDPQSVDILFVRDASENPVTQTRLENLLSGAGRGMELGPRSYITLGSLLENVNAMERTVKLTTGTIAVFCLLLGGVTLMSLMLANVSERTSEIGLRRALGASRWQLYLLFFLEGVVTTFVASLIGICIAAWMSQAVQDTVSVPMAFSWSLVWLCLGLATLLGAIFSLPPAMIAAQTQPALAMRNE